MAKSEAAGEPLFSPADWHILVVEDSATQALKLEQQIAGVGYKVSRSENGAAALALLEGQSPPPDLVVSDIVMPTLDGYGLCQRIRESERLRRIPVLLLSSLSEPEDIITGLSCGANNFLAKPYAPEELLSRIHHMLVNSMLRQTQQEEFSIDVFFNGKKHTLTSDRFQILDLLFSTYDNVLKQKRELERVNRELREALDTINVLENILPICSKCKKIRDQNNQWHGMEDYISQRSHTKFSHGLCPECAHKLYPDFFDENGKGI